jgi:hypothetical protein
MNPEEILEKYANIYNKVKLNKKLLLSIIVRGYLPGEEFLRYFKDEIDWKLVSEHQLLSEEFVYEFIEKLYLKEVIKNNKVSFHFIKSNLDKINAEDYNYWYNCVYSNLSPYSEEEIKQIKEIYEMYKEIM